MSEGMTYQAAGVDVRGEPAALAKLLAPLKATLTLRKDIGAPLLDIGYFANVIRLSDDIALALSTDGVGTKLLVAQMMGKYDTVGIDCVAMNVNDVLCVGAEPVAMLDYLAVEKLDEQVMEQIGIGLAVGAEMAGVAIVGGELAQLQEMVKGLKEGFGFDLAGMAVGVVHPHKLIIGADLEPGDVLIGLKSSGIHSNGLTLARRIFFDVAKWDVHRHVDELGRTIGEELLEPTRIYVKEVLALLKSGIKVKALVNITGGGFLNLLRTKTPARLVIEQLPPPPTIFALIQRIGSVTPEEMFTVFNMGIGFCVMVAGGEEGRAMAILGEDAVQVGKVESVGTREVVIAPNALTGHRSLVFGHR